MCELPLSQLTAGVGQAVEFLDVSLPCVIRGLAQYAQWPALASWVRALGTRGTRMALITMLNTVLAHIGAASNFVFSARRSLIPADHASHARAPAVFVSRTRHARRRAHVRARPWPISGRGRPRRLHCQL